MQCATAHFGLHEPWSKNDDIALIRPEDSNRAYERVVHKAVRYRLVIDLASMQSVAGAKS